MVEQWIVAPKVVGSSPSSYPMHIYTLFYFYNYFTFNISLISKELINKFDLKTSFLSNYYRLVDLMWQEGLLFDFLQKKVTDNWIKKFLIYSSYLFNERYVFDKITKFYLDLIIWPSHKFFIFEFNNVSNTLFINIFFFIFSFFIFSFVFFWIILF